VYLISNLCLILLYVVAGKHFHSYIRDASRNRLFLVQRVCLTVRRIHRQKQVNIRDVKFHTNVLNNSSVARCGQEGEGKQKLTRALLRYLL
jgi:hypothetical protein